MENSIETNIKDSYWYLVWLEHCTWNGADGFRLLSLNSLDEKNQVSYRGYDCTIDVVKRSKGGKYIQTREWHHDVPMGHTGHILALSEKEYIYINSLFNRYSVSSPEFKKGIQKLFGSYLRKS